MSAFTETALVKKLTELNASQQSIQTMSLWLIHHRKHYATVVRSWYHELVKAPINRKLTYMYLGNDVIQNSKKKGPEYGKEFHKVLKKVFSHIDEVCRQDDRIIGSLGRILKIWEDRGVYEEKSIEEFRNELNQESKTVTDNGVTATADAAPTAAAASATTGTGAGAIGNATAGAETQPAVAVNGSGGKRPSNRERGRSRDNSGKKRQRSSKSRDVPAPVAIETASQFVLSPRAPAVDAPDHTELIKAIMSLENSASSDVITREAIANFPPEVSEIALLAKLEDKESAVKLAAKVNEAANLLHDYNTRLAVEMDDRKTLQAMLKAYQTEQKDLLKQAEQRLEEYNTKLVEIKDIQKEIHNHLKNLPDLTQLPDVTGGLAPLPSAGDLFNVH